jgi:hypothetical protein
MCFESRLIPGACGSGGIRDHVKHALNVCHCPRSARAAGMAAAFTAAVCGCTPQSMLESAASGDGSAPRVELATSAELLEGGDDSLLILVREPDGTPDAVGGMTRASISQDGAMRSSLHRVDLDSLHTTAAFTIDSEMGSGALATENWIAWIDRDRRRVDIVSGESGEQFGAWSYGQWRDVVLLAVTNEPVPRLLLRAFPRDAAPSRLLVVGADGAETLQITLAGCDGVVCAALNREFAAFLVYEYALGAFNGERAETFPACGPRLEIAALANGSRTVLRDRLRGAPPSGLYFDRGRLVWCESDTPRGGFRVYAYDPLSGVEQLIVDCQQSPGDDARQLTLLDAERGRLLIQERSDAAHDDVVEISVLLIDERGGEATVARYGWDVFAPPHYLPRPRLRGDHVVWTDPHDGHVAVYSATTGRTRTLDPRTLTSSGP